MPQFPAAVKTFVTRSAAQTIDPSHVNDLQDEVNAIESGYLNGTARISASNATAANLSVAGGSTFVGSFVAAQQNTFGSFSYKFASSQASTGQVLTAIAVNGSTVTLEWRGVTASSGVPSVKLALSTIVALGASAYVSPLWDVETYDTDGMHSTASNSSRITFADSTGLYAVGASLVFSTNTSSGQRECHLLLNDVTGTPIASATTPAIVSDSTTTLQTLSVATIVRASATSDYVTVRVKHSCGASTSSLPISGATNIQQFWAFRVRG